jgi:molecular chaperone GrpE
VERRRFSAFAMQENKSVTKKPEAGAGNEDPGKNGVQADSDETGGQDSDSSAEVLSEEENELIDLQLALGAAEKEQVEYRESMLRMQAEMENLRKRLIKDLDRSRRRALESIMNDLLPVRDSLERGLETDDSTTTVESMKEGKALIIKMLDKVMQDHGLKVIDPLGEPFNPELHQAMTLQESAKQDPDTVLEVMQKGFLLNDRLIRPAMVVVCKEPAAD